MDFRIEVRPLAVIETIEAYDWYEEQLQGLGADFLEELDNFYKLLLQNPYIFSYYDEPVREGKINRFPYVVIYEVFDQAIAVYSVFMSKQDPDGKRTK
jgi:mRNA-degrading endonuclease RelE of RelBE toxin-antitoxin system